MNRGGSFRYGADLARSAYRLAGPPSTTGLNIGVRPARALDSE
jgi:formylglycine-generating enzyme required for sulfatase activity